MTDDYAGGARQRLTEAININDLREKGGLEFEILKDREGEDPLLLDEEAEEETKDEELLAKKRFFQNVSLKNMPVVSCTAEDALGDYDEMEKSWPRIAEGVQKKIFRPGKGGNVPPNAKVTIQYVAYHENSDEPFDDNTARRPRDIRLGHGDVIPGLEIAVASMELKEIAKFLIQPELGFGALGCPPTIPPNARVLFSVELLNYQEIPEKLEIFDMTAEERAELPFDEVYKAAESLKVEAKTDWEREDYQDAAIKYSKAAKMLEEYYGTSQAEEEEKNKMLYTLFNNLAICYLKMDKAKKSRQACKCAIQLPISTKKHKAYYTMGKALFQLGHIDEARDAVEEAQSIDSNDEIRLFLDEIVQLQESERSQEKNLCKKMLKQFRV